MALQARSATSRRFRPRVSKNGSAATFTVKSRARAMRRSDSRNVMSPMYAAASLLYAIAIGYTGSSRSTAGWNRPGLNGSTSWPSVVVDSGNTAMLCSSMKRARSCRLTRQTSRKLRRRMKIMPARRRSQPMAGQAAISALHTKSAGRSEQIATTSSQDT